MCVCGCVWVDGCVCVCVVLTNAYDCPFLVIHVQHKKLSVEGAGTSKDFRKGQKQGDLEIWDPVDQVLVDGSARHQRLI